MIEYDIWEFRLSYLGFIIATVGLFMCVDVYSFFAVIFFPMIVFFLINMINISERIRS